jgi:glutathionylspermidine synthase
MERRSLLPRRNWREKCEALGFDFHSTDPAAHSENPGDNYPGDPYWDERCCYCFSEAEIEALETATATLHSMCLAAIETVIRGDRWKQLGIPARFIDLCTTSWEQADKSLYGRFDLFYDGTQPPKLLEYNADTPTALLEASVIQWDWLNDVMPEADQFNSIHEKLIDAFSALDRSEMLYFTCAPDSLEDLRTVEYLQDVALQAGFVTQHLFIDQIGWDIDRELFCDLDSQPIRHLFKLYPWEWLMAEEFGPLLRQRSMTILEPAWKLILSSKGFLPILWDCFPGHPNLLPSYFTPDRLSQPYVSKPLFSREGANITRFLSDRTDQTPGPYNQERVIYQAYCPPPQFDSVYPVIGSWIIADEPAGIGIRESDTPVTQNTSRFVPHYIG